MEKIQIRGDVSKHPWGLGEVMMGGNLEKVGVTCEFAFVCVWLDFFPEVAIVMRVVLVYALNVVLSDLHP